jgi:hypothetical protein
MKFVVQQGTWFWGRKLLERRVLLHLRDKKLEDCFSVELPHYKLQHQTEILLLELFRRYKSRSKTVLGFR